MEMGIFQALPMDGSSATAASLSEKLGVEKDLLGKLPIPANLLKS
jgi:hypothetical protein